MAGQNNFYYVYLLESLSSPSRHYTGYSRNYSQRLSEHNSGKNPHTSKYRPWRIQTVLAFTEERRARDFERYLKSPSGRAFSRKRL
ncbi:MAG: GIY-YIG nuclease family protein [Chitinivibrionales bacterium]|nr:GIY-YIG nuclease family protein [Chitinivibrionales bacterium]